MNSLNSEINKVKIQYLNEGLLSKLVGWFKNLYKSQNTLREKNNTLDVDTKNIKSPDKSTQLKDIEANKEELKLINDPEVGFPVTSMIIKQKNKYLVKEYENGDKKEYVPLVDRYFYVEGNNKYDIGIIMYDESIKNDSNYVNMINLEVIAKVDNQTEIEKFINTIFEDKMKKNYKGAQYTGKHPRVKGVLLQHCGYKSQNNNKDILFKNFK